MFNIQLEHIYNINFNKIKLHNVYSLQLFYIIHLAINNTKQVFTSFVKSKLKQT